MESLVVLKNKARGHASGAMLLILSQNLPDQGTVAITTRVGTYQKLRFSTTATAVSRKSVSKTRTKTSIYTFWLKLLTSTSESLIGESNL